MLYDDYLLFRTSFVLHFHPIWVWRGYCFSKWNAACCPIYFSTIVLSKVFRSWHFSQNGVKSLNCNRTTIFFLLEASHYITIASFYFFILHFNMSNLKPVQPALRVTYVAKKSKRSFQKTGLHDTSRLVQCAVLSLSTCKIAFPLLWWTVVGAILWHEIVLVAGLAFISIDMRCMHISWGRSTRATIQTETHFLEW